MDPDALLDELLALHDRMRALAEARLLPQAFAHDIHRMLELIDALDGWLTSGGFLPNRWQPSARHADS